MFNIIPAQFIRPTQAFNPVSSNPEPSFFRKWLSSRACCLFLLSVIFLIVSSPQTARVEETSRIDLTPEERAWLKTHPEITVGSSSSYPPHVIKNPDGTYTGVNIDFYEQISQILNSKFKLHVEDVWSDVQKKAKNRELDGLTIVGRDPNRDLHYNATDIIYPSYFSVFADSRDDLQIKRFSDLDGMRIGYKRGARPARTRLENLPSAIIKPYDSHESMTQALLTNEIDVIVAWMSYDHWRKKTLQGTIDKIYLIKEFPLEMVGYFRKDWPELIPIVNKAIAVLQKKELPLIIDKWFGEWPQEYTATSILLTPEEQVWLAEHPEIVLGAPTDYPPMVIKRNDGSHVGVLVDLFEKASKLLNSRIRLHIEDSWGDVQKKAEKREIDGLAFGGRDPGRASQYNQTNVLITTYFSVFARSQNEYQLKKFSDLDGMYIGYKRAARPTRSLLEKLPTATLKPYDSHEAMTQALLSREIDVIVAWMSYDHWRKDKLQGTVDNILLIDEYPIDMVSHIRKDWPELVPILNKSIAVLQQDELPSIINTWFGQWPQKSATTGEEIGNPLLKFTDRERSWLLQNHTVRVRTIDWPPYQMVDDNEPPQGIVIEYLKRISERTGIAFKYEVTDQPFAEFLEDMKQKQGPDMTAVITPTPERKQYLLFSEPYFSSPFAIFTRKQDELILDISALEGRSLATTRGTLVHKQIVSRYPDIKLVLFASDKEALQSVATGQVDGYIGSLTVASNIINRQGYANLQVTAASPFGEQSLSIANRNDWPELTSIINKALASITEEEKTAILTKFLSIKYEQGIDKTEVIKWVLIAGAAALGIILIVIIWNRQLSREVGKRRQTEEHLKQARDDADAANQAKSQFLANMSHELRTPLNAILGFSRTLARESEATTDQQEKLAIINRSGEHLLAMVNEVLDLSKIEAGRVVMDAEVFDLQLNLEDVGRIFKQRVKGVGLRFTLNIDSNVPKYVKTDADKLRQILINLLNNALKFTSEGDISLRVRSLPMPDAPTIASLELEVEDSGCGISPEMQERIFKPSYQIGKTQAGTEGAGLGLAISRSFVEVMGGTISVDSTPGKGSLFRVELPVALVEAEEIVDVKLAAPSVIGLEPDQPTYRILVVEDNRENRLLLSSLLKQAGFELREAENGEDAIELFQQWQPHFIWMDMRMPGLDGYETTRQIRDLPGGETVKIVAITASVYKEQEQEILLAGCDKVVHKPFKDHEIYETMAQTLNIKYLYEEKSEGLPRKEKINLTKEMLADLPGELLKDLRETTLALNREASLEVISIIAVEAPDVATGLKELVDNYQMDQLRDLLG